MSVYRMMTVHAMEDWFAKMENALKKKPESNVSKILDQYHLDIAFEVILFF